MLRWANIGGALSLLGIALLVAAAAADMRLKAAVGQIAKPPANRAATATAANPAGMTHTASAAVTTPLGSVAVTAGTANSAGSSAPLASVGAALGGVQVSGALNQLTVADLIGGFQQFVTGLAPAALGDLPQVGLSTQQQQQVEYMQGQLDRGEIDENAFATGVHGVVGDAAPNTAFGGFGFFGGPFISSDILNLADALSLTEAQWQQVLDIVVRLHADIDQLRQTAHEQILAVLTPEQQAQLIALDSVQSSAIASQATAATTGQTAVAATGQAVPTAQPTAAQSASTAQPKTNVASKLQSRRAAPGQQGSSSGVQTSTQTPAQGTAQSATAQSPLDPLQLTDAQQSQIEQIRTNLRTAVQARHQQARDEFLAILTPEQQAQLTSIEQSPPTDGSALDAEP